MPRFAGGPDHRCQRSYSIFYSSVNVSPNPVQNPNGTTHAALHLQTSTQSVIYVLYRTARRLAMFMSYEFDVFVSYRRHGEWPLWTAEVFRPLLYHWLGEELGRDPNIFVDTNIETGDSWPERLGNALGRSRILLPLLSRQYFSSRWCRTEFALMRARESTCNLRSAECPHGLIIPAHIHDGKDFPVSVNAIQSAQLQAYTNVRLAKGSVTEERLSEEIRKWMPDVASAIGRAPEHDAAWVRLAADKFLDALAEQPPRQLTVPSLG